MSRALLIMPSVKEEKSLIFIAVCAGYWKRNTVYCVLRKGKEAGR